MAKEATFANVDVDQPNELGRTVWCPPPSGFKNSNGRAKPPPHGEQRQNDQQTNAFSICSCLSIVISPNHRVMATGATTGRSWTLPPAMVLNML